MTDAALTDTERPTTPLMHSSCNDGVIRLCPLSSYVVLEVVEFSHASSNCTPSLAVCPALDCSQLDLNPANLEATIEAE